MIGFTTEEESQKALVKDTAISETKGKTVLELYPQYGFGIAERIWKKDVKSFKCIGICFALLGLLVFCTLIADDNAVLPLGILFIILFITSAFVFFVILPKKWAKLLALKPKIFYVQTQGYKKYCFIVDENKHWGLIDSLRNIKIKPRYNLLKWHQKGIYLEATLNNEKFIVDINGNKCL